MAKYKGSVTVPGGLTQPGANKFPIVNAPDVQVDDEGTRLDTKLENIDQELSIITKGVTFTPEVSPEGDLSWSNDQGLENPDPVNIKGPKGDKGDLGAVMKVVSEGDDVSVNPFEKYRIETVTLDCSKQANLVGYLSQSGYNIACSEGWGYIYTLGGQTLTDDGYDGSTHIISTNNKLERYNIDDGNKTVITTFTDIYNPTNEPMRTVRMIEQSGCILVYYKNTSGKIAQGMINDDRYIPLSSDIGVSNLPRLACIDNDIYLFGASSKSGEVYIQRSAENGDKASVLSTTIDFDGNAPCAAIDFRIYLFNQNQIGIIDTRNNSFTKIQSDIDLTGSDLNAVEAMSIGSKIYLFDGTNTIKMFDTKSQMSFQLSETSIPNSQLLYYPGICYSDNYDYIYIVGGGKNELRPTNEINSLRIIPHTECSLALSYNGTDYPLPIDLFDQYSNHLDFEILGIKLEDGSTTVVYSLNGVRDKCTISSISIPAEECQLKISKPKQVAVYNTTVGFGDDNPSDIEVDNFLSTVSENPVQNKVITEKFNEVEGEIDSIKDNLTDYVTEETLNEKLDQIDIAPGSVTITDDGEGNVTIKTGPGGDTGAGDEGSGVKWTRISVGYDDNREEDPNGPFYEWVDTYIENASKYHLLVIKGYSLDGYIDVCVPIPEQSKSSEHMSIGYSICFYLTWEGTSLRVMSEQIDAGTLPSITMYAL